MYFRIRNFSLKFCIVKFDSDIFKYMLCIKITNTLKDVTNKIISNEYFKLFEIDSNSNVLK